MKPALLISIRQEVKRHKVSHSRIQTYARSILERLRIRSAQLDLLLVSDATIRKINRKLLGHDWATDVISVGSPTETKDKTLPAGRQGPKTKDSRKEERQGSKVFSLQSLVFGQKSFQGNIVISLDTTARQAKEYGTDFFYELMFYLCHGILHILEWEDDTAAKRRNMWKKQEQLLKQLKVKSDEK